MCYKWRTLTMLNNQQLEYVPTRIKRKNWQDIKTRFGNENTGIWKVKFSAKHWDTVMLSPIFKPIICLNMHFEFLFTKRGKLDSCRHYTSKRRNNRICCQQLVTFTGFRNFLHAEIQSLFRSSWFKLFKTSLSVRIF